jgi:hypothetical protein
MQQPTERAGWCRGCRLPAPGCLFLNLSGLHDVAQFCLEMSFQYGRICRGNGLTGRIGAGTASLFVLMHGIIFTQFFLYDRVKQSSQFGGWMGQ